MSSETRSSNPSGRLAWVGSGHDPALYSAIEEACLRESQADFLLLWINRPSVFVGKNQNIWAQVSAREAYRSQIPINRRLSGGGTVYHDPGNLNFSLISSGEAKIAFEENLKLILPYFQTRGIDVEIRNKSDLFCGGRKISGNAEYFSGGRVLHHGTLLFDANLEQMGSLLTTSADGYVDRGIDSNRSETINLKSLLSDLSGTHSFAEDFLEILLRNNPSLARVETLPDAIEERAKDYLPRFHDVEWIYGSSPAYHFERSCSDASAQLSARVSVKAGRIESVVFHDASPSRFPNSDYETISKALTGIFHYPEAIHKTLSDPTNQSPTVRFLSDIWLDLLF